MKKLLLYTIFLFIQHIVFGQHQLDSVVRIVGDTKFITAQKHDVENRQVEVIRYEVQGKPERVFNSDKFFGQYDERGNELVHIRSSWNDGLSMWWESEKIEKIYDDSNRVVSYAEYEMRNGEWMGLSKTVIEFEEQMVVTIDYSGEEDYWMPTYKNVGQFNEHGDEVLTVNYKWDSIAGDWAYWMKNENTFLQDTLLEESATYTWEDGQWVNSEKVVYKYRPDMDKVSDRVVYVGTADGWQFKYLTQMKYYDAVQREEVFYWSEGEELWRAETFKESYIDKHGRETDFVLFVWNLEAEEYRRNVQGMTVYDAQDRVTLFQEVRYEDGIVNYGMEMLFDFDKDGNMYRETHRSLIPNEGWTTLTTKEFAFNKEIVCQDGGETRVLDRTHIGYENSTKNKHVIDSICSYRYVDGQKVLQEETKYYYSTRFD